MIDGPFNGIPNPESIAAPDTPQVKRGSERIGIGVRDAIVGATNALLLAGILYADYQISQGNVLRWLDPSLNFNVKDLNFYQWLLIDVGTLAIPASYPALIEHAHQDILNYPLVPAVVGAVGAVIGSWETLHPDRLLRQANILRHFQH